MVTMAYHVSHNLMLSDWVKFQIRLVLWILFKIQKEDTHICQNIDIDSQRHQSYSHFPDCTQQLVGSFVWWIPCRNNRILGLPFQERCHKTGCNIYTHWKSRNCVVPVSLHNKGWMGEVPYWGKTTARHNFVWRTYFKYSICIGYG